MLFKFIYYIRRGIKSITMIKRKLTVLLVAFNCLAFLSFAQVTVWTEDFGTGCNQGQLASAYAGTNGAWSITNTGTNDPEANTWFVSATEAGLPAGSCGDGCISNGTLTNRSLHLGNVAVPAFGLTADNGASYNAGGLCGLFFCVATDRRAESPTINLTGQSNLTLNFNYMENGQAALDDASLWYFDGTAWSLLNTLAKTPTTCTPQGQWTAFSVALPATADNNPNVKIGFRWVNNDDGTGTDPSFAVDDITITTPSAATPPVADFSTVSTSICAGSCIDFTNLSTFAAGASFNWNFGDSQTSTLQTPTNICYNNAGTFTVTLTVTDANGTDTETKTAYITVTDPNSAGVDNSANVCNNTTADISDLLNNADVGGIWDETTGSPSGQFNTTTAVLDANDLTPGIYTFTYTVNGPAPCGNDVALFTINVQDCSVTGPTAIITVSNGTVCQGQSLIFNSTSTGSNISAYAWSFGGGTPGTANTAGPHSIVFNTVGNFNVLLTVTDEFNVTDDTLITIQVISCSTPTAAFSISDNDPCEGDCITFTNNSSSVSTPTYAWSFPGGSPSSSTLENPGPICYNTPGNYTATLVVTNSFGTGSYVQNITVLPPPVIDVFGNTFINLGENATIGANSTDGEISWTWTPNNQGDILECTVSDCSQALVSPVINTTFAATVTTDEGCTATDFVLIGVNVPSTGYAIGVPNSFSPNGDNRNDILMVDGLGISSLIFRIYNRYGQLVFESTDQSLGWDGNVNGEPLNPATFAWTLECIMVTGDKVELNGNVTLIK